MIDLNALPPWQMMCTSKGLRPSCSRFWISFTPHCVHWCLEASHVRVRSRDRVLLDRHMYIMADFARGNKANFRLSLGTRERGAGSPDYFRLVCDLGADIDYTLTDATYATLRRLEYLWCGVWADVTDYKSCSAHQ